MSSFKGALQTDGYAVYDEYDTYPDITRYGCWAHARRYFYDALENEPKRSEEALKRIGRLYDIERMLRETDPSPDNRKKVRQKEAVPVLEAFKSWLESNRGLPKSPYGKAVNYALSNWKKFIRYTGDGRIEIDNNLIENQIRPIALGRNYVKYPIM